MPPISVISASTAGRHSSSDATRPKSDIALATDVSPASLQTSALICPRAEMPMIFKSASKYVPFPPTLPKSVRSVCTNPSICGTAKKNKKRESASVKIVPKAGFCSFKTKTSTVPHTEIPKIFRISIWLYKSKIRWISENSSLIC